MTNTIEEPIFMEIATRGERRDEQKQKRKPSKRKETKPKSEVFLPPTRIRRVFLFKPSKLFSSSPPSTATTSPSIGQMECNQKTTPEHVKIKEPEFMEFIEMRMKKEEKEEEAKKSKEKERPSKGKEEEMKRKRKRKEIVFHDEEDEGNGDDVETEEIGRASCRERV